MSDLPPPVGTREPDRRVHVTVPSTVAIRQHPIHPMLVIYPIGFLSSALATDLAYWYTAEAFWAVVSFWLVLAGFVVALLAAAVGMIDFFTMVQVRRHVSAWNHFLCGIMVISIAAASLLLRLEDPVAAVLPWGLFLSAVLLPMVMVTGWLGGTLTFRHSIGAFSRDIDREDLDSGGSPRPLD